MKSSTNSRKIHLPDNSAAHTDHSTADRYIRSKKLQKPESNIDRFIKIVKNHASINFIDFAAIGDDMKIELNVDDSYEARKVIDAMRSKNDRIKETVEKKIIEKDLMEIENLEKGLSLAQKEARRKNEAGVKKQRIDMLNEYLPELRIAKLEGSSRINLEDFIRKPKGSAGAGPQQYPENEVQPEELGELLEKGLEMLSNDKDSKTDMLAKKKEFISKFEERVTRMLRQLHSRLIFNEVKNRRRLKSWNY